MIRDVVSVGDAVRITSSSRKQFTAEIDAILKVASRVIAPVVLTSAG